MNGRSMIHIIRGDDMPNRYVCDVLDEMRKCHETRNYSGLDSLRREATNLTIKMILGVLKCLQK